MKRVRTILLLFCLVFFSTPKKSSGTNPPTGYFDSIYDGVASGWAFDPADTSKSLTIELWFGGLPGSPGAVKFTTTANIDRPDVNTTMKVPGKHGFRFFIPPQYRHGSPIRVYGYALNAKGVNVNAALINANTKDYSPFTFSSEIPSFNLSSNFVSTRSLNQRRIGFTQARFKDLVEVARNQNTSDLRVRLINHLLHLTTSTYQFPTTIKALDYSKSSKATYNCMRVVTSYAMVGLLGQQLSSGDLNKHAETNLAVARKQLYAIADQFKVISSMNTSQVSPPVNLISAAHATSMMAKGQPFGTRVLGQNYFFKNNNGALPSNPSSQDELVFAAPQLAACLAVGYDWLYESIADEDKATQQHRLADIEGALIKLLYWGNHFHNYYFGKESNRQLQNMSNWNPVFNANLALAGIALLPQNSHTDCAKVLSSHSEDSATLAQIRVCLSLRDSQYYWRAFTSTGTYSEGPTYFFYGMEPYAMFFDSVKSTLTSPIYPEPYSTQVSAALKFQMGLLSNRGDFWKGLSGSLVAHTFSDSDTQISPSSLPFLFQGWLNNNRSLRLYGSAILNQQISNETRDTTGKISRYWAQSLADESRVYSLFYAKEQGMLDNQNNLSFITLENKNTLDSYVTSEHQFDYVKIGFNPGADFWETGIKGGKGVTTVIEPNGQTDDGGHTHLDSGSFALSIGGVPWVSDLGTEHSCGYPAPYFNVPSATNYPTNTGWQYFRKNDLSHNLVTPADHSLSPSGSAKLIESYRNNRFGNELLVSTWDTTTLYGPEVLSSQRQFAAIERGKWTTLDVRDNFHFSKTYVDELKNNQVISNWHIMHCDNHCAAYTVKEDCVSHAECMLFPDSNGHDSCQLNFNTGDDKHIILDPAKYVTINGSTAQIKDSVSNKVLQVSLSNPANASFSVNFADPNYDSAINKLGRVYPSGFVPRLKTDTDPGQQLPENRNSSCVIISAPLKRNSSMNIPAWDGSHFGASFSVRFQLLD